MAEVIIRIYNMADDVMLERGEAFHDSLSDELATFTLRFPWLDTAWLAAFQSDMNAADAFPTDESVVMDQKVLTGDVASAMQQGYAALHELGAYAELAYPQDLARQRVFGQQYWTASRKNTLKLQEALELAHEKASIVEYRDAVLDKGYEPAAIGMLLSLADELKLKNRLQEAAKIGRRVSKHDRVALHNVVWNHMRTINICASVVWANDAERMGQYQLYPSTAGEDVTSVSIAVTDAMTNPLADVLVQLTNTTLTPQRSDASGVVLYEDNSIPELLNIRLEHSSYGVRDFNDQPITPHEDNELRFMM